MPIKRYKDYPHGMEEVEDGDYVDVQDITNILNQFLGELDKGIIENLFKELTTS